MNQETSQQDENFPLYDQETEKFYSLEVVAELAGISIQTVLYYYELGVIPPTTTDLHFNIEDLRLIRRIDYLRHHHELTDGSLKLVANLLNEVEQLRKEQRNKIRNST
jgi:DNA-binding transcriptional MerR regulator